MTNIRFWVTLVTLFVVVGILLCLFLTGPWWGSAVLPPPWQHPERTPVEIVGGYSLGRPALGGLRLYLPPEPSDDGQGSWVEEAIVRIGWNEDFILIERHDLPLRRGLWQPLDFSHPEWHIIVVSTGEGSIRHSHDYFLKERARRGVPDSIEMRDARQVYYGGWIPRYRQSD